VLAKILLEDAPRASDVNREVPAAVADLVARLLAKNPAGRPRDAAAAAAALDGLLRAGAPAPSPSEPPPALPAGEPRVISVILATLAPPEAAGGAPSSTLMVDPAEPPPPPIGDDVGRAETLPSQGLPGETGAELRAAALELGGQLEVLADGSVLATLR